MPKYEELLERYIEQFREGPLNFIGLDEDAYIELMEEALRKGRPIPDDDYDRHVPRNANA